MIIALLNKKTYALMLKQVFYFVLLFLSKTFCCDDKEKEMIFELPVTSMTRTEPVVTTETSNLDHELKMTTVSDINTPIDAFINVEINPSSMTNERECEIVIKDNVHHSPEIILEPMIKTNEDILKNQEGITPASKTQDSSKLEIEFETQNQGINVQPFTRNSNRNSMDCGITVPNDAVSRSVLSETIIKVIEMVKNDLEPLDKGLIIEFPDKKLLVEKVTFVHSTTKDLTDLIESLNTELSNVTKFYSYYDILSYIDKSIALINRFFFNPNTDISKDLAIRTKKITEITTEIENAKKFSKNVKEQFLKKDSRNFMECNSKNAENKLSKLDKHIECLEKQFNRYKVLQIEDEYKRHDEMKIKQLNTLQKHLETIREKTFPMNEEEIQKYDDLFKNNFFTVISEVHKNLISCYDKEQNSLKWLFEIFDTILEGIRNCIEQLKSFENVSI